MYILTQRDFSGFYSGIRRDSIRIYEKPKEINVIGTSAVHVTVYLMYLHNRERTNIFLQKILTLQK